MELDKAKFMSIGSNCYNIAFLGNYRVRGPIDNILSLKGLSSTVKLFDGTFEEEILNSPPWNIEFKKNSKNILVYTYEDFQIIHNDPLTEKFKKKSKRRLQSLETFSKEVRTNPNFYFVYTLGIHDVKYESGEPGKGKSTEELTHFFLEGLEALKNFIDLNKVIFVGTFQKEVSIGWAKNHSKQVAELGLKYVEITDVYMPAPRQNQEDFLSAVMHF